MSNARSPEEILKSVKPQDLVNILKKKFEVEKLSRFFEVKDYRFSRTILDLDSSNSLLLEFRTLQGSPPEGRESSGAGVREEVRPSRPAAISQKQKQSKSQLETDLAVGAISPPSPYKLLFILGLQNDADFSLHLLNEIGTISNVGNISRIVILSLKRLDVDVIQILKEKKADVVYIDPPRPKDIKSITNFIPISTDDYEYVVVSNVLADLVFKRLKKLFHLVLSEIAAPSYNEFYGKTKAATKAIMDYEEEILDRMVRRAKNEGKNHTAVDVGCGTGRHSFVLADAFEFVYAFDFSPAMIEEAKREKTKRNKTNIFFGETDIEYEEVADEDKFYGTVDLITASFGMGSFIEDTAKMLRRYYDWLKPGGYLFLSFYNKDSILLRLIPNWRDTSLSAHLDLDNETLRVELNPQTIFHIYCKPFDDTTRSEINGIFNIEEISTYPTTMALLPNSLLENEYALEFFRYVDKSLATDKRYGLGHYVIVAAHKPEVTLTGYSNVMTILENMGCAYEILEHGPVLSIEDVLREIGGPPECMVKTVIFKVKRDDSFVSVSLLAEKRVGKEIMADLLREKEYRIKFAPEKEVIKLGFPVGGIAPFGFETGSIARMFIDRNIRNSTCEWFYMGVGDNRKTLKIRREDLLRIVSSYEDIVV